MSSAVAGAARGVILHGTEVDGQTLGLVNTTKQLVVEGTLGSVSGQTTTEIQTLNKFLSIQIVSALDFTSLVGFTVGTSTHLALPSTLTHVIGGWDKSKGYSGGVQNDSPPSVMGETAVSIDGVPVLKITDGFRGAAKATHQRLYFNVAPVVGDVPTPTIIKPSIGTAWVTSQSQKKSLRVGGYGISGSFSGFSGVKAVTVGPVLTNSVAATNATSTDSQQVTASAPSGGGGIYPAIDITASAAAALTLDIAASTPVVISSGDIIVTEVNVERWRFGVYVMDIMRAVVP